jgi:hypothetical protein
VDDSSDWETIWETGISQSVTTSTSHQHVTHDIDLLSTPEQRIRAANRIAKLYPPHTVSTPVSTADTDIGFPARYIRLIIIENGAAWGASLWRFEVFGHTKTL